MAASTQDVTLPKGSEWYYSLDGSSYTMLGVLNGDTTATWNYDSNKHDFHDGQSITSYSNQTMAVGLTLADLNPQALSDLSGGMLSKTDTAGASFSDAPDQTIAAGWTNMKPINFAPTTAGGTAVILSASPTLTSVTGSVAGALTEGADYYIVADDNSFSGWSIVLDTAGAAGLVTTESVVIDYGSLTPTATTTLAGGSSSYTPDTIALRGIQKTTSTTINIHAVTVDGGSYNFGFKGTASDGTDEMVLAFSGELDASKDDGEMLFDITYTV